MIIYNYINVYNQHLKTPLGTKNSIVPGYKSPQVLYISNVENSKGETKSSII